MATRTAAAQPAPARKTATTTVPAPAAVLSDDIGEPVEIDKDTPTRGSDDIVMSRGEPSTGHSR